ncbi:hypothetical protein FB451DRAFT_1187796 [Mycena latifolia]|nr:hypothetical protein FB451DRAFT_1187785 [Mycena latifolia]KAJ7448375.1 hypothetical protein FB451DRAFT_1187796 [Mycena latifolia]
MSAAGAINAAIDAAVAAILASNPNSWRRGGVYPFQIPPDQCPPHSPNQREIKIGFSSSPRRRKREWMRQCFPQQQEWLFYYDVPDARRFEALIHLHFKLQGAWIPPRSCEFCGVRHQEKFDHARCGGIAGVIIVMEYYLWRLGWPSVRTGRVCDSGLSEERKLSHLNVWDGVASLMQAFLFERLVAQRLKTRCRVQRMQRRPRLREALCMRCSWRGANAAKANEGRPAGSCALWRI